MKDSGQGRNTSDHLDTGLSQTTFFGDMVAALSGTLEEVVGLEDASAFTSRVGNDIGRQIASLYRDESGRLPRDPAEVAALLCDMKSRIGGEFRPESVEPGKLTFTAAGCPFGARAIGKPSLCMMTTNVFGRIAADATGYAAVRIDEAISLGHDGCRVTVYLDTCDRDDVHEFFGTAPCQGCA